MKPKPRDPWVQRWLDKTTPADNTRAPSGKPVPRAPGMGRKVLDFLQQHVLTDPSAPGPLDASVRNMVAFGVPPRAARAVADFGMGATEPLGSVAKGASVAFREVEPELFDEALRRFAKEKPDKAGFITWRTPEQMRAEGMRTFLDADGKVGYALGPTEQGVDIRNVFNAGGPKGAGAAAVAHAVENGGEILDAFDTDLTNIYRNLGFKETWRAPWDDQYRPSGWDEAQFGTPDVIGMRFEGPSRNAEDILSRYKAPSRSSRPGAVTDSVASAGARALRSKAPVTPGNAPAVVTRPVWKPQSRGVFDRSLPDAQGTVPVDPRVTIPEPTSRMSPSPLVEEVVGSRSLRRRMREDAERGLEMGGRTWYNPAPVRAGFEETQGAMPFEHWTAQGAATSPQNPVVNEISGATIANFGRLRGLSREQAVDEFLARTGSRTKPLFSGGHYEGGQRAVEQGYIVPADLFSDAWKVPGYFSGRIGGGGLQIGRPGWMPALDTHEKRMIWQAIMDSPTLTKKAKQLGIWDKVMAEASANAKDPHIPIRNSVDYQLLGAEYIDLAKRLGLPTAQAGQAGRWLGGAERTGVHTGLGDYTQILEDQLLYTAQQLGLPDDPRSLRSLFQEVARGNAFLLPHHGNAPLPLKPQSRSPFAFGGIGKP